MYQMALSILSDSDGSGDDVIYAAATAGMTKPAKTRIAFARDEAGKPQQVETIAPSGLSVFFSPLSLEVMDYSVAIDEMCDAVEDEATRNMLRAIEVASLRYLLAEKCGLTVTELREAGLQNVYYKTVRDEWQSSKDRDYGEISKYQEQSGIKADITGLSSSDWDAYVSAIIDLLNRYSDVDTETWLALLTAQQSSQMLDCEKTTAIGVDKTGDGVEDAYRVTISAPLNLVGDVYTKLSFRLKTEEGEEGQESEEEELFRLFLDIPDDIDIAKVYGDPVQDEIVYYTNLGLDMAYGVRDLFERENCTYELPAAIDYWYELLDSEGIGHVISVDVVDLGTTQDLKIPVVVHFAEPTAKGEDWNEDGYLVYGNGHFKGFLQASGYYPMISLNNSAFYGATIQTAALLPINIFGLDLTFFTELSEPFALPEERDGDCGMKLVKTPIGDIKDLADKELTFTSVVTDLYGKEHDVSAAIQAAREESLAGNVTYSLEAAEITAVPDAVFNRRLQEPEVTVTIGDRTLERDVDYELTVEPMLKVGTKEITLFGIGDYVGHKSATFTILPAESTVEALDEVALSELSKEDMTVLTVNTPAHPENVQFDFSGTDGKLRDFLKEGADGKTVLLKKGAEAGSYEVRVSVVDGGADTYSNIDGAIYVIEVK